MQPVKVEDLLSRGQMPTVARYLSKLALATKEKYESLIGNFRPSWWARMALSKQGDGGGGIAIRKVAGGLEVYYVNSGKYNYLEVIEKGRGVFDMKSALLRSPRARSGKNGRYIIIPMRKNKDGSDVNEKNNQVNSILKRTGHYMDKEGKKRISYAKVEDRTGKGNVFGFQQGPVKSGNMQYSYTKFVAVSERSTGWQQKAITGVPIEPPLQKEVNKTIQTDPRLQRAISDDLTKFYQKFFDR